MVKGELFLILDTINRTLSIFYFNKRDRGVDTEK